MSDYKTLDTKTLLEAPNIADVIEQEHADEIGKEALAGFQKDIGSRAEWAKRNNEGMNLAMQLAKEKNFPWPRCSNVMFPLITVAALQYHARAYPALVNGVDVFQARVIGDDPQGFNAARADRISTHMSWQALEQDDGWEEEMDKALLIQPIAGCVFKKTIFDPTKQIQTSQAVSPRDLVISYYTKNLDESQRYTHKYFLSENAIRQKQLDETFCKFGDGKEPQPMTSAPITDEGDDKNRREGREEPGFDKTSPYWIGEQYCWYDFDGDGFKEPYVITIDLNSGKVWRIVARYDEADILHRRGEVYSIAPTRVFTKYPFIPSPDGGIYDLGLGALAGPINHSVNSIINQVIDSGTMSSLGGGFVGRGFKGRGGPFTFKPYEWHPMDGYGDDIRKNVLPLPVKEPSPVLFQLLGFLVEYGERIVSSTEIQSGSSPGQNQKAETTRILNENGQRIYTGTFKRTWRAMRHEACIRFDNNKKFLIADKEYEQLTQGRGAMIRPDDYKLPAVYVRPAADPTVVSTEQQMQQAQLILQNAMSLPGHNKYKAIIQFYKRMRIPGYEDFVMKPQQQGPDGKPQPAEDYPPPQDPKAIQAQAAMIKAQSAAQESQMTVIQIRATLQRQIEESFAKTTELYAKAALESAQAEGARMDPPIKLLYAQIEAEGKHRDALLKALDTIVKIKGASESASETQPGSAAGNGAGAPPKSNGAGMGGMETQQSNTPSNGGAAGVNSGMSGSMG